jgi:hypothetical protein
MSDTEASGKYTDEDVQDNSQLNRPQGEYTDSETVSETHSTDGAHSHSESEHSVNGNVVEHNVDEHNAVETDGGDDGQIHDERSHDILAGDGVGEGELDLEDRTERHS